METAESKLLKETVASESFIKSLMAMPFGDEKSVIMRNLRLSFFGTTPMGDVRKFGNGRLVKGPDIRFSFNSSNMQLKIAVECEEADCKLSAILENSGPE